LNAIGKYFEYRKRFTGPGPLLSAVQIHFETGLRPRWLRPGRPTQPISSADTRLGVVPTAHRSQPPAMRPDRASCGSDARHLPPSLHAQHMQPPPVCTALCLTRCPYPLDAKAKPRLPSPLPCNAPPLPSPVRAPPLCTDDVRRDQITAQENHLLVTESCSPLATSPSPRGLKATNAAFFFRHQAPHRGRAANAMGYLHHRLPKLPANTAHSSDPRSSALHLFCDQPSPVPHNRPASPPQAHHSEPLRYLCPKSGPPPLGPAPWHLLPRPLTTGRLDSTGEPHVGGEWGDSPVSPWAERPKWARPLSLGWAERQRGCSPLQQWPLSFII
jgi:hypothetical protein